MRKKSIFTGFAAAALAVFCAQTAWCLSLPKVFGDNMVLQQGRKVPVWGKAAPGEKVTVSFAGRKASAAAGADGRWRVDLPPLEADAAGRDFTVEGSGTIVFKNVVVGEVWFCSGQSNMEFPMDVKGWRSVKDAARETAAANHPLLRHFNVAHKTSAVPLDDVEAKWVETTPETVKPQSAVAYFFGETLLKRLGTPVGLINCSWGGTRIEPWTPAAHPDDLWLLQNVKKWGRPQDVPTVLWNGMVSGLVPYAIKGAIWYQGEANRTDGAEYIDKTVSLVRGWRREWGQGDFPYFLVQLAPYKYDDPKGSTLAEIQMAQAKIPEVVPESGCTVINDVGNVADIHPTDKRTVGMRLADQALDRIYGRPVRPWKTPAAKDWHVENGEIRVSFENADGLETRDGKAPTEFEIRDMKRGWVPAKARIEGTEVVLECDGDAYGVRFAPYNGSTPNLVNGAGLPAGPFRILKPCPLGAAEGIPLSEGFLCAQRYDIPANCDVRKSPPAELFRMEGVDRVGYLLELENAGGDTSFAFAEMDAFDRDSRNLILTDRPAPVRRAAVRRLRVFTNAAGVKAADDANGFVEFYTSNYSPRTMEAPAGGDAKKYDFNDEPTPATPQSLGYGCLQVHNLDAKATVLAFNHFTSGGAPCDVGLGNSSGENPDWTFARNAASWKTRRISVWVKGRTSLLHLSHVHRGGGKFEAPDNTLATFMWCWRNGSALECDCRKTKDGVGIMLHDPTLKRTARGISPELAKKDVSKEVTWAELKDIDVGSYLKELNPSAKGDLASHRIPTIEETFAAIKGRPDWLCFVDEKGAGPEYIARKAVEAGVAGQIYYTGQDYGKALDWGKTLPGGKTLLWIGTWPKPKHDAKDIARFEAHFEKKMDEMRANGFKGVSAVSLHTYYDPKAKENFVPTAGYLKKIIAEFHAHGIPVCSIPFEGGESEEVYFKLFELGCDGFSSDYPGVMFSVIKKLKEGAACK